MSTDFSWLFGDEEEESGIKVPTGGTFVSGFAGQWVCVPMYRAWYDEGISLGAEPHQINAKFDHFQKLGRGSFYYWMPANEAQGVEAATLIAGDDAKSVRRMSPRAILRFELPLAKWVNAGSEDSKTSFSDPIAFDMPMTSLFYKGIQYEYHLFFLPSLVQEIALVNDLIKERLYDYAGLLEDGDAVNEEYTTRMIGESNGKEYKSSELWLARKEIWAALGEDNTAKYTRNMGGTTDTEAPLLSSILRVTTMKATPIWSLMQRVANPIKNEDGSGGFPCRIVAGVFTSEEACRLATAPDNVEQTDDKYPALPEGWRGQNTSNTDWINWAKEFLAKEYPGVKHDDLNGPLIERNSELKEQYAVSAAELIAWLPYLS